MDGRLGFIHEELDIKVLILFILRRLPEPVLHETLSDIILLCDSAIGYFEFTECIADLIRTEHITESKGKYIITDKGRQNGEVTESGLPYSVRIRAEQAATTLAHIQRRSALITATHEMRRRGGYTVKLAMSDGIGPIISLEILAGNDKQAMILEKNFKKNAESIYNKIINILTDE